MSPPIKVRKWRKWLRSFVGEAEEWSQGRMWYVRGFLWTYFAYVFIRHLANSEYHSLFGGINLGIHELGHLVFRPLGEFISVTGGTFWELLVPVLSFYIFHRQRDFFALFVSAGWLSTALFDVATYAGDARAMELPLVSPFGGGEDIIHDWNHMLGAMGLLNADHAIAFLFRLLAAAFMLAVLLWGGWLLRIMMRRETAA
jgi:hypothetical protein